MTEIRGGMIERWNQSLCQLLRPFPFSIATALVFPGSPGRHPQQLDSQYGHGSRIVSKEAGADLTLPLAPAPRPLGPRCKQMSHWTASAAKGRLLRQRPGSKDPKSASAGTTTVRLVLRMTEAETKPKSRASLD